MNDYEIKSFLERFVSDSFSEEEHFAFIEYLKIAPVTEVEAIVEEYLSIAANKQKTVLPNPELVLEIEKALDQWDLGKVKKKERARIISFSSLKRMAAAVVIGLLVLSGTYLLTTKKAATGVVRVRDVVMEPDVMPGGDKAILTLADGSHIVLDSAANGALTNQGGMSVIKAGGQLVYNPQSATTQVLYNTVSIPKGGQYQLVLADGTRVWLNAASSLRYPTAFTGKDRRVELTGEGYFEVAHNSSKPFHVLVKTAADDEGMDVRVLGTHFNINSYGDEEHIRTTLLEGSVLVSAQNLKRAAVLKPGEQARLNASELTVNKDVNVEEVVAWKNGKFIFPGSDIRSVMRQLSRWYDVDVDYAGTLPEEEYVGVVSRTEKISAVLKMLEKTETVSFKIVGRKVTVIPFKK